NEGDGKFRIEVLPLWVQLSSVNAVEIVDINGDKKEDLMLGGNKFVFPPQFGRLDASYGHVLLNEGGDKWKYIGNRESGMSIRGEIKDIKTIHTQQGQYIIATVNNERPVVYRMKR
ncbi:MAG TPA: CRTAC1 family protein, partial [Chitinophagaceae bacterium]